MEYHNKNEKLGERTQENEQENDSDPLEHTGISTHLDMTDLIKTELIEETYPDQDGVDFNQNCHVELGKCKVSDCQRPRLEVETVFVKTEIPEPSCDSEEKFESASHSLGVPDNDPLSIEEDVNIHINRSRGRLSVVERKEDPHVAVFSCQMCPYRTANSSHITAHITYTNTNTRPFKCGDDVAISCRDVANNGTEQSDGVRVRDDPQSLAIVVAGIKTFRCQICAYKTARRSDMRKHITCTHKMVYDDAPFKCSLCPFRTKRKKVLKQHVEIHTGKKHKCAVCPYSCETPSCLKRHMATHTGTKPYACHLCPFSCSQSGNLTQHIATHMNDRPHKCPECSFSFSRAQHLKSHMTSHSGLKPFECGMCSFRSSRAGTLKVHMATHLGLKPFKCPVCEFSCSQAFHLKSHMYTHTGLKPFVCPVCEFSSSRNEHLKRHMTTHMNVKRYGCAHCEHRTSYRGSLIKHLANKHGM